MNDKNVNLEQEVKALFALCASVNCLSNRKGERVCYFRPEKKRNISMICDILKRNGVDFGFHNTAFYRGQGVSEYKDLVVCVRRSVLENRIDFYNIFQSCYDHRYSDDMRQLKANKVEVPLLYPLFSESRKVALINKFCDKTR